MDDKYTFIDDTVRIKLYNKNKEYICDTVISKEDYELVSKYNLYCSKQKNTTYVRLKYNGKEIPLHHLIKGKPEGELVVDHINNNGLNNTRENLRIVSRIINGHNKKKKENTLSSYIGVSFQKQTNKWRSYIKYENKQYSCGLFDKEINAAKEYDRIALQIYKKNANTNNLLTEEEKNEAIKIDFEFKKRDLPKNISKYKNKSYRVKIAYNNIKICVYKNTLEQAKFELNKHLILKKEYEDNELEKQMNMEISKHNDVPIILIKKHYNIYMCYVDEDIWHKLNIIKWYIHNNYAVGSVNNKMTSMHSFVYQLKYNKINSIKTPIDHINNDSLDNRILNLRITSISHNNQNKSKTHNTSNKYIGVTKNNKNNKWTSKITKNYKVYNLGEYLNEIDAAKAYNKKAIELYGENAKVNVF